MQEVEKLKKKEGVKEFFAIVITCIPAWIFTYFAMNSFREYAWGLFIWLPFVMGVVTTILYSYKSPLKGKISYSIPFLALMIFSIGLLVFAWEGLLCLIMVAPLSILCNFIGHILSNEILKKKNGGDHQTSSIILLISVPIFMAFENAVKSVEKIRSVTTSVEIDASPEVIWKNVIEFPQLNKPTEFIFKAGIAYPINATIHGKGVGAVRYCNFSTGSFTEPITIWEEAKLLKFDVVDQPEPMKELSPYKIQPNHLHGYWVSKKGQFKLIRKSNGKTVLEGTTWYINKIKPGFYWNLWSAYIVHKIHQRVLKHIKQESEKTKY